MQQRSIGRTTIIFGIILIVIGVSGYFLTGRQSVTALIPAFIGAPVTLLSLLGICKAKQKLFSSISAVIILLGFGGCVPGLMKLVPLLQGADIARPAAVYLQSIMAGGSIIYLTLYAIWMLKHKSE